MAKTVRRKRTFWHTPRPFSEMSTAERIREARNAIWILNKSVGQWADANRPAIARWESTLRGLGVEP
jgi:hypothetical protein